jgi:DNA ligase-1
LNTFAGLLDRLGYEPSRLAKSRLMTDYFRTTPDPDRGYALAALTGALTFAHAKSGLIRALIGEKVDPYLFELSYDHVGDLSETVALLWPAPLQDCGSIASNYPAPTLAKVVHALTTTGKIELPKVLAGFLDELDETGRWALLKLITGSLRIGASARLAKLATAELGGKAANEIDDIWHALEPPYLELFAWLEGHASKPDPVDPAPFRPAMLAHALQQTELAELVAAEFCAEWKWDGIRVQAVVGEATHGRITRLYSRTGEEISAAFPDLAEALAQLPQGSFSIDGELLIRREARIQPFGVLQQRLNRKSVSAKLLQDYPAHIRAYDLLALCGEDLRPLPFAERRRRLEDFVTEAAHPRLDLSVRIAFQSWDQLAAARHDPAGAGAAEDAEAIEGIMLKRADSIYVPGRPKGLWYKWKRDPFTIDAVLMYAQRGHGKRSSLYSDFTFGVWRDDAAGATLVPVGKAYFGFTDAELRRLDLYVRNNTINRFGPVREVSSGKDSGLVLEIAFEGLNRSPRHKSGLAMRFPRINRIRWDKPAAEADRIETLAALLKF